MRILRFVLINIVVLFLLLSFFAALLPSRVRISRAIDIDAPLPAVRAALQSLNGWDQWNMFIKELGKTHASADDIRSLQLSVVLTRNVTDTIETKWQQQNGKTFTGAFALTRHSSLTTVQWYFDFRFRWYPWEKFSSMIYDQQLGPQMEQSLSNLKRLLEKEP